MTPYASCLYFGEVVHQRFSPRRHRLRYPVFQALFDLDELPRLSRDLRFFSHNRANLFAFYDRDHGQGVACDLRAYVRAHLIQARIPVDSGRILLLCMPRIFGFVFNPLSIFYCFDRENRLRAMLYEVSNTFGQRHIYLIPADTTDGEPIRQSCSKVLHVSPFMGMDMTYDFKVGVPGGTLGTSISGNHSDGHRLIFASFTGARRELSDWTLVAALVKYPLLTLGVVAAIHWEAAKLFAKGLRLRPSPSPPQGIITILDSPRTPFTKRTSNQHNA